MQPSSATDLTRRPGQSLNASSGETVGQQNMLQLIQLRWIAVIGQVLTIAYVSLVFKIELPLIAMSAVLCFLVGLNLFSLYRPREVGDVRNGALLTALLLDVAALTALLYMSGGATNPFVFLYLLQVAIGAVLLEAWSTWTMVVVTSLCFAFLMRFYMPLDMRPSDADELFHLHVIGMLICFALDVGLLVVFMTRINRILRGRDARLADLRQRAAEEDHIVRMGLLASGAAHELGTPLATLSVILGDWRRMSVFRGDPELLQELGDMQAEVQRCKTIVTGILLSAGEARGESPAVTTIGSFLDELVEEWRSTRPVVAFDYDYENDRDGAHDAYENFPIVSDSALKQVICTVLDNALESSPLWVGLSTWCSEGMLSLAVRDRGPGFEPEMLAQIGKPYQSSKGRPGGGLGLFLVVNVVRKLGGNVSAENAFIGGGAVVTLNLPLAALSIERTQNV
ncbi:ATP-binding protein [Hydrocarboniphaga sp.]|uniref:ATP-binding protein n=1 Tax=Hydrocarboniphaga sp. TaxID=2033016 RepID=UPI003452242E